MPFYGTEFRESDKEVHKQQAILRHYGSIMTSRVNDICNGTGNFETVKASRERYNNYAIHLDKLKEIYDIVVKECETIIELMKIREEDIMKNLPMYNYD